MSKSRQLFTEHASRRSTACYYMAAVAIVLGLICIAFPLMLRNL